MLNYQRVDKSTWSMDPKVILAFILAMWWKCDPDVDGDSDDGLGAQKG